MDPIKIALIGGGQMGSRHLQSLCMLPIPALVQVVEPSLKSRSLCHQRIAEIENANPLVKIEFNEHLSDFSDQQRIVIVATDSFRRRSVIDALVNHVRVDCLILEKVLFQSLADFAEIGSLLEKKEIKTWVNCPRRQWPFYQNLLKCFRDSKTVNFSVSGSRLGIGCNSIHFLDLFSWLTHTPIDQLKGDRLDPKSFEAKRPEFREFTGTLHGLAGPHQFTIQSFTEGTTPFFITITSEKFRCLIRENERKAWLSDPEDHWQWREVQCEPLYQSQLTNKVVMDLLNTRSCDLPTFQESRMIHEPFIQCLLDFLGRETGEVQTRCPIT